MPIRQDRSVTVPYGRGFHEKAGLCQVRPPVSGVSGGLAPLAEHEAAPHARGARGRPLALIGCAADQREA